MKISRLTTLTALVLVALAGLVAGCGGNDDDIPVDAVAVVDGTVITKANLEDLMSRAKASYKTQKRDFPKVGTSEYQSLQAQAVAYLVQREEYEHEAKKLEISVTDAQIDKRVGEVAEQYFGGDKAELDKQLKAQGYTQTTFRADIRAQLVQEALFAKAAKAAPVTQAEIEKFYRENKAQYSVAESRQVRHILVKTKAQADDVVVRLKNGEDFGKLAKELSQDPGSKDSGGELTVRRGETVAEFDKAAFSLKVHELSAPIKTQFGYHVIEALSDVTKASTTPLASVSKQIKSQLAEQRKQEAIDTWSNKLRDDYKKRITYATGYAPASSGTDTTG
ncbi:MAG: peptidylprolyl isomerase [Gaiellales bacterium]